MSDLSLFAPRLRERRECLMLTQEMLAKRANLKPCHVSHFETGNRMPSCKNLAALADALRCSTDYLLGRVRDAR